MSTGPSPTLAGSLTISADSLSASLLDANRDVAPCYPTWPGIGGGDGPATCSSGAGGAGASIDSSVGPSDGTGAPYGDFGMNGTGGGGAGGDYSISSFPPGGSFGGDGFASIDQQFGFGRPGIQYGPITIYGAGGNPCPPPSGTQGGCVPANARISLFPEGCCSAGELAAGDIVMSRDSTGASVPETVTAVHVSMQPILAIYLENGKFFTCSTTHLLMTYDTEFVVGRETTAETLVSGSQILTAEGKIVKVDWIEQQADQMVYQVVLKGPHHLYVADGVWCHNKAEPTWP